MIGFSGYFTFEEKKSFKFKKSYINKNLNLTPKQFSKKNFFLEYVQNNYVYHSCSNKCTIIVDGCG